MAGTKSGGIKAAKTNKAKYGEDFYARIGAKGGKNGNTGGFYANRPLAKLAGAKGGRISRRGMRFVLSIDDKKYYKRINPKTHEDEIYLFVGKNCSLCPLEEFERVLEKSS